MYDERKQQHRLSNASLKQYQNQGQPQQQQHHPTQPAYEDPSPTSSLRNELTVNDVGDLVDARSNTRSKAQIEEQEKAAQDIAFERDYVLVEKKHVEVNAFADEMAANPRLAAQYQTSPKSGHAIVRRATQQGNPTSATGAVAPTSSRAMQVAQGTMTRQYHGDRPPSLSASPNSATSFIAKAIHDASFRLLGVKNPVTLIGKGASPPQLYSPFPAYPTPSAAPAAAALITDGRTSGSDGVSAAPADSDTRVAQLIEDYATRSDVVFGFAEVKYKQLVPLAPSAEHDLSGVPVSEKLPVPCDDEDELTIDAIVVLSEEALVLYVKALSLLAKSMDIASMWWRSKMRGDSTGNGSASHLLYVRESPLGLRVNAAVQWIRSRFNEVLEKANFARERLVEVQRRLPEDHPSHPSNQSDEHNGAGSVGATAGSGTDGVFLSAGVSAEKLMYDRAVEMSRAAAIGEISNDDLSGCELSYMTAICMLEAVLDTDDEPLRRRSSASGKDEKSAMRDDDSSDINTEDQKTVEFMINMIKTRLNAVRKKAHLINSHSKAAQRQDLVRRRSGDVTPRSVPSHAS
jgi:serine/threonine-protein kinase ULK2